MGVKDGFMGASIMMKVTFILLCVANLFNWISFTTTSWGYIDNTVGKTGYGLWRSCNEVFGTSCGNLDGTRKDWLEAFQAFGIFGYVGINVAMFLVILIMFVESWKGNAEAKMGAMILCFVAAVCWLIAIIIFADKFPDEFPSAADDEFGYSFVLAILAFILAIVAGVLLILDGKVGGGGTSPA